MIYYTINLFFPAFSFYIHSVFMSLQAWHQATKAGGRDQLRQLLLAILLARDWANKNVFLFFFLCVCVCVCVSKNFATYIGTYPKPPTNSLCFGIPFI